MSLTGAEVSSDAAASATWIEVQFAADPNPQATGASSSQAMEKLLIDAQRESGQSSLAQSGSASPAIAGSGSRSPAPFLAPPAAGGGPGASMQSSGGGGAADWQRDWPTRFVASQPPGSRQFQVWRYLSLRKTSLVRGSSLLLNLLSHAASFLLGATSMYIICRGFSASQQQLRIVVR